MLHLPRRQLGDRPIRYVNAKQVGLGFWLTANTRPLILCAKAFNKSRERSLFVLLLDFERPHYSVPTNV